MNLVSFDYYNQSSMNCCLRIHCSKAGEWNLKSETEVESERLEDEESGF